MRVRRAALGRSSLTTSSPGKALFLARMRRLRLAVPTRKSDLTSNSPPSHWIGPHPAQEGKPKARAPAGPLSSCSFLRDRA